MQAFRNSEGGETREGQRVERKEGKKGEDHLPNAILLSVLSPQMVSSSLLDMQKAGKIDALRAVAVL
jgi:hypothetical protein